MATPLATRVWWWFLSRYQPDLTSTPAFSLSSPLVGLPLTLWRCADKGDLRPGSRCPAVFWPCSHSLGTLRLSSHSSSSVCLVFTQSVSAGLLRGFQLVSLLSCPVSKLVGSSCSSSLYCCSVNSRLVLVSMLRVGLSKCSLISTVASGISMSACLSPMKALIFRNI